jgi:hypothetical protein
MSTQPKIFVAAVIAVAAAGLASALLFDKGPGDLTIFAHCLALALLTSTFKVRLPGMRNSIAASFVLFLIAIAHLNLVETLILTIPCTVLQCLWRPRSKPRAIQVVFSVACTLISTGVAALLFFSVDRKGTEVPALVVAATAFFFVNSLLMATVMGLVQSESIGRLWRELHRWAFPYYVGGAFVAALVVIYSRLAGFHQALAMLPLLYAVYLSYDTYVASERQRTAAH